MKILQCLPLVLILPKQHRYIFSLDIFEDNFHLSLSAFYASNLKFLLKLFRQALLSDQSWPSLFFTFDVVNYLLIL